jgi:uncharacterized protein YdcH (DUF465 family)
MSIQHFKSLLFKASKIQQQIEQEQRQRWPDTIRLLKLKKTRLQIKDRLRFMLETYLKNMNQNQNEIRPMFFGVNILQTK